MRKTLATQLQEIKDYNLAKQISETESPSNQMLTEIQRDIVDIKEEQHNINDRADGLGQYIRLNILEFWNFLYLVHPSKEDCAKKIINFLHKVLGIKLRLQDIDIAHRNPIAKDRKKQGKGYLPPIYVKFVHKSVVQEILSKRHLLRKVLNSNGQPYMIKQNLTLHRRELWSRVQNELTSYPHAWIHNGKIYVRKQQNSRSLIITGERKLEELLREQKAGIEKDRSTPSPPEDGVASRKARPHMRLAPKQAVTARPATSIAVMDNPGSVCSPSSDHLVGQTSQVPRPSLAPLPLRLPTLSTWPPLRSPSITAVPPNAYSYTNAYDDIGYKFTAYEKHQLSLGNRNSLLSPGEQKRLVSYYDNLNGARKQYTNGAYNKSRSFSR